MSDFDDPNFFSDLVGIKKPVAAASAVQNGSHIGGEDDVLPSPAQQPMNLAGFGTSSRSPPTPKVPADDGGTRARNESKSGNGSAQAPEWMANFARGLQQALEDTNRYATSEFLQLEAFPCHTCFLQGCHNCAGLAPTASVPWGIDLYRTWVRQEA